MDRKTLTGFILIGAILLLWPSYLEFISPSEKSAEDVVVPDSSLVEKYSAPPSNKNIKILKKILQGSKMRAKMTPKVDSIRSFFDFC